MHFRIRGNNVQIVKTVTDPATQKIASKPVGSANLTTGEIGEKVRSSLTPAEIIEVKAWIGRQQELAEKRCELEFQSLPQTLSELTNWVRRADETQIAACAQEVLEAMRRLRVQISRRLPQQAG